MTCKAGHSVSFHQRRVIVNAGQYLNGLNAAHGRPTGLEAWRSQICRVRHGLTCGPRQYAWLRLRAGPSACCSPGHEPVPPACVHRGSRARKLRKPPVGRPPCDRLVRSGPAPRSAIRTRRPSARDPARIIASSGHFFLDSFTTFWIASMISCGESSWM